MPMLDKLWLDTHLDSAGSNQARLSRALRKHRSAVTRLLQGKRQLKLREVPIVASHLGCTQEEVMQWAGLDATARIPDGFDEVKQSTFETEPSSPSPKSKAREPAGTTRHPLFGIWKGKVTLDPDYDYAQPADPDWGKVYDD